MLKRLSYSLLALLAPSALIEAQQARKISDPQGQLWSEAHDAVSNAYYFDSLDTFCPQPGQVDPAKADLNQHLSKYDLTPQLKSAYLWFCNYKNEDAKRARAAYKNADTAVKTAWQNVFGLVYKTLDIMKKGTYPSQGIGGEGVAIYALLPHFTETQGQLRTALDEAYFTRGVHSAFDGRGRVFLPQLELIYQQLENLRLAAAQKDYAAYNDAFASFCHLGKNIQIAMLTQAPVPYKDIAAPFPKKELASTIRKGGVWVMLYCAGLFVIGFFFLRTPRLGLAGHVDELWHRFSEAAKKQAYEYNRQFLGIGAGWLLYGPVIISVILGLFTMNVFIFVFALFVFGYLLPSEGLKFVKERRRIKIESQLLDALILLSDAMKSGLDLVQGLELAVHEMVPPISDEFDLLIKNYKLGMPFDEALKGFDQRVASELVSYVVRAIIIQRQTGGNLTKIFDRIVETIREEGKLQDKVNALTAGPRMQSIVISVLPWGMVVIVYFFSPQMIGGFFASLPGIITIIGCVFWQTIGLVVIRKLAKIEV